MAITIADVAQVAGVSTGTVSRVLNGASNVRPDTRARVEQAIAQLGFQPNLQARSLRSKRTNTIALVIPELTNHYWTAVATGVQHSAQSQGYHLILTNSNSPQSNHLSYLEPLLSRVDGVILTRRSERGLITPDEHPTTDTISIPAVFIGQSQAVRWQIDSIYSDSISGAYALTNHLIQLGHRHIAIVSGRETSSSASERVAGYCLALVDAHIPIDARLICWGKYQREAALQSTYELMLRAPEITAIVGANNEIAIGIMCALDALGRRVPQDAAVACFEEFYPDSRFASIMTCADTMPYYIGVNATQMLLHRINSNDYLRPRSVILPTRLIVRQSCGGGQVEPFAIDRRVDSLLGEFVSPLPEHKVIELLPEITPFVRLNQLPYDAPITRADRSQINQIRQILQGENPAVNTMPHCEYAVSNKRLYRYVLEREPVDELIYNHQQIVPEDQIEFAYRTGAAAAICHLPIQAWAASVERAEPQMSFAALFESIDYCDRYVQAARNASIGLGIEIGPITVPPISSRGDVSADGADERLHLQYKLAQILCDRFTDDFAFALVTVRSADGDHLDYDAVAVQTFLRDRLDPLLHPAHEHGLPTVLYLPGKLDTILPLIHEWGIHAVYPANPERNDLITLKQKWQSKLTFMGGIPLSVLANNEPGMFTQQISSLCLSLAAGGGWIGGVSGEIGNDVPYEGFLTFLQVMQELNPSI